VFDRPIGKNKGVQFPIAESLIEIEAANLMRFEACELYDAHQPCGAQANMAKYLAAKASWEAANVCMQTHGGFGFANEHDIERRFRETRLYQVAPIATNMIFAHVAEHVLGLPRSFEGNKMEPPRSIRSLPREGMSIGLGRPGVDRGAVRFLPQAVSTFQARAAHRVRRRAAQDHLREIRRVQLRAQEVDRQVVGARGEREFLEEDFPSLRSES